MEILGPDKKFLNAPKNDILLNINLENKINDLYELNNTRVLSLDDLFQKERKASNTYRIYGVLNFVSFLNDKKQDANNIFDLFIDDIKSGHSFHNEFNIFIGEQSGNSYNNIYGNIYQQTISAITTKNDYKLNFLSYSKNIYNEKKYFFQFNNIIVDREKLYSLKNNSIVNNKVYLLFLPTSQTSYTYSHYNTFSGLQNTLDINTKYGYIESGLTDTIINKIIENSNFTIDLFKKYFITKLKFLLKTINIECELNNILINIDFIREYLNIGNSVFSNELINDFTSGITGNYFSFDEENYLFSNINNIEFIYVKTLNDTYNGVNLQSYIDINYKNYEYRLNGNTISIDFKFKYNPIYEIDLSLYESFIEIEANPDIVPDYSIYNGKTYLWRNLMDINNPDNIDYPFINNVHYIYNDITLFLKPDLSDKNTAILFNEFNIEFQNGNFIFNNKNINPTAKKPKKLC
jgi:hypothetical protein